MKIGNIEHDIDYNVQKIETADSLSLEVDNLRLGALANLEQLHQLLVKHKLMMRTVWSIDKMITQTEVAINILRKDI